MTMQKTQIVGAIAASAVLALALLFVVVPITAQADDWSGFGDNSFDGTCCDFGGGGDSGWSGFGDNSTDGTCCDTGGFTDENGFSGGGFGGGSFGGGGSSGGWSMPTRSSGGGMSQYQSLTNTNVNENYCTNGSCNTNNSSSVNAPTNIISYAPAAQTYSQPNYPVYPPTYNQPTYYPAQQQRPIAYNNTPYVTLAAVPYTGLELGPVGTALYWGFLVLWCLIAAYLIVVKKIQNKIAAWFTGSTASHTAPVAQAPIARASYAAPAAVRLAGIDPFIQAQINRAK